MLVESMNQREITAEVYKDYLKIIRTARRLRSEYHKERRDRQVEKSRVYVKDYAVKTKTKNNWIIFLCKAPALPKYQDEESIAWCAIVYHYGRQGLKVYKPTTEFLAVYNGHLFTRYNERLHLDLSNPLDIIKRFFRYSGFAQHIITEKKDRKLSMAVCSEGMMLGETQFGDFWIVNKTFITRDMFREEQNKVEKELMDLMEEEINTEWQKQVFDRANFDEKKSMQVAISNFDPA